MQFVDWLWTLERRMNAEADVEAWFPYFENGLTPDQALARANA